MVGVGLAREGNGVTRYLRFKREDGSQVLVTIWPNGRATMAEKEPSGGTWGPPLDTIDDISEEDRL